MTPERPVRITEAAASGEALEGAPDSSIDMTRDEVVVETAEQLAPSVLEWMADAALVVHTIEEYRVVPWAPNANEMWELGKLSSERLGILMKIYRAARSYGLAFESRAEQPDRHFRLDGVTAKSWHDVIVFEAIVGPFFRVFYESFFRSSAADVDTLSRELWEESQRFIRFGQARTARAVAAGERADIQAALEKWLAPAVGCLGEVPVDLDEAWQSSGLRSRSSQQVRQDYLDEIATYLQGNDLEIPDAVRDAVREVEVKWLGVEVAGGGDRDRPLKPATFAFTDRLRRPADDADPGATSGSSA
jgi:1,2-phenylacetyl-CoA epoxidase catalytic subunit